MPNWFRWVKQVVLHRHLGYPDFYRPNFYIFSSIVNLDSFSMPSTFVAYDGWVVHFYHLPVV